MRIIEISELVEKVKESFSEDVRDLYDVVSDYKWIIVFLKKGRASLVHINYDKEYTTLFVEEMPCSTFLENSPEPNLIKEHRPALQEMAKTLESAVKPPKGVVYVNQPTTRSTPAY
jgi:hypothetical protein